MKRLIIVLLIAMLVLGGCSKTTVDGNNLPEDTLDCAYDDVTISEGRVVICDNGSYLLVVENSPTELITDDKTMFDGLTSGDLVSVKHGVVAESYPGQTSVYEIEKLEDGELKDVDYNVLTQFKDLGWIDAIEGTMVKNSKRISYEYAYADMSLLLPEGWVYDIEEYTEDCHSFGIKFRPSDVNEGWIELGCYTSTFAVCGTGLESEETKIGEYDVSIGRYDGKEQFDYIVFKNLPGEYVVDNFINVEWYDEYSDEIMSILDTVELGTKQIGLDKIGDVLKNYDVNLDDNKVSHYFDVINGVWEIKIYNGSDDPWYINFDSEGQICDSNYIPLLEIN